MEGESSTSSLLEVTDAGAATLLTDWRQRRFLEPFMRRPTSLGEAARELGVALNALHYRVKRLRALGLLEPVAKRPRKGRAVVLYAATAEAFLVPFAATAHADVEAMLRRLSALDTFTGHVAAALTQAAEPWGILIGKPAPGKEVTPQLIPLSRAGKPEPRTPEAILAPEAAALFVAEQGLELDFATAKELQRDLAALARRYEARQTAGEQAYFVALGLTPMPRG